LIGAILCNKDWFDKLKPEQQQAVQKGWNAREQAQAARSSNDKFITEATSKGITVYKPTPAELALWQAAGKRAADEMLAGMGPEALKIRDEILKDIAGTK
jgi:TRAP-type C4-dicarboxylate transport system substrate-binding protein